MRQNCTFVETRAPCKKNNFKGQHAELILSSFSRLTGKNLIDPKLPVSERYRQLYEASFCAVSHNAEADPVFNYGNQAAQALFEMDWDDFIKLPSRLSAEQQVREERERLLSQVEERGFVDDYVGVRISSSGKRFLIENAVVWNLINENGDFLGQAAVLYEWSEI